jgi:hypothetical protein
MNYNAIARAHLKYLHTFKFQITATGIRDSAVGIATRYGLDAPGIKCRWGRNFPRNPAWSPLGQTASCTMFTELSLGVKWAERGADHLPPSAWLRVGWNFTSTSSVSG